MICTRSGLEKYYGELMGERRQLSCAAFHVPFHRWSKDTCSPSLQPIWISQRGYQFNLSRKKSPFFIPCPRQNDTQHKGGLQRGLFFTGRKFLKLTKFEGLVYCQQIDKLMAVTKGCKMGGKMDKAQLCVQCDKASICSIRHLHWDLDTNNPIWPPTSAEDPVETHNVNLFAILHLSLEANQTHNVIINAIIVT